MIISITCLLLGYIRILSCRLTQTGWFLLCNLYFEFLHLYVYACLCMGKKQFEVHACSCMGHGFIFLFDRFLSVLGYLSEFLCAFLSFIIYWRNITREKREEIQLWKSIRFPPKVDENRRKADELKKLSLNF